MRLHASQDCLVPAKLRTHVLRGKECALHFTYADPREMTGDDAPVHTGHGGRFSDFTRWQGHTHRPRSMFLPSRSPWSKCRETARTPVVRSVARFVEQQDGESYFGPSSAIATRVIPRPRPPPVYLQRPRRLLSPAEGVGFRVSGLGSRCKTSVQEVVWHKAEMWAPHHPKKES